MQNNQHTYYKSPTVATLLLEYLKLEGINKIFGVSGGAVIFVTNELKKTTPATRCY